MGRDDPTILQRPVEWPTHGALQLALYFRLLRHLRVVRARTMRVLRHRLNGEASLPARPVRGHYRVPMWPDWADRTYAYCHYGTYGRYLPDLLARIDRPFVFLDIGANRGLFSLVASQNRNCRQIVALEPVARTFAQLRANLEVNGLGGRARALNVALSNREGTQDIALKPSHSGMATLHDHLGEDGPHESISLVTMEQLDRYIPAHLPIFVKIDVEGHEPIVIEQLMKSAHRERVFGIFYELDQRWADAGSVRDSLEQAGFTGFTKFGIGRHYDMLATRNCLSPGRMQEVA